MYGSCTNQSLSQLHTLDDKLTAYELKDSEFGRGVGKADTLNTETSLHPTP